MCGIAGYFGLNLTPEERQGILGRMCHAVRHRGPDDEGYYCDGTIGLGMRRLSVIDLVSGQQPIATADGRFWIVFNGEIYNYQALRSQLEKKGVRFRSASDTEVLLQHLALHGVAGLQDLNGMFAFAFWDRAEERLMLARDRLGVKPLYYYWDGQRLLFASEIKAILVSGLVERRLHRQAVWDYLTLRYVPSPHTIWRDIYKVPPGHYLTLEQKYSEARHTRYWRIPFSPGPDQGDAAFDREFSELFRDAVRLRMIADVPVGITLSGGLDSSSVAAVAASETHAGGKLNTFSVGFADSPETDELPFARIVADHLGTQHHEIVITEREFIDFLPIFVYQTDEPLADLASVPLYYVSRLARESVKVVLSGEGSDEVLGGYDFDLHAAAWDQGGGLKSRLVALLSGGRSAWPGIGDGSLDYRLHRVPPNMTNYMTVADKRKLMGDDMGMGDSFAEVRTALEEIGSQPPLNQWLCAFSQSWLVEDLLMKADKMSMANSLELRTPFLDYRLVEWAARVPPRIKVGKDENGAYVTKRVLRRFARELLPPAILERPKQGFPVPVYDWLSHKLGGWAHDVLGGHAIIGQWFDRQILARYLMRGTDEHGGILDRHRLWNLLILELWAREWRP